MTHRAIERANPQLDVWQRRLRFVEVQYGPELAAGYRRWLATRGLIATNQQLRGGQYCEQ